jgi:hypothetical protein
MLVRRAEFVKMKSCTSDLTVGNVYNGFVDGDCFNVVANDKGERSFLFSGEFELLPVDSSEVKLGIWKLRVRYEDVEVVYCHRYYIELLDLRTLALIQVDSNVIDNTCMISMEEAYDRCFHYLKHRFGYELPILNQGDDEDQA